MKSMISLGLAVGMLVACGGGAHAEAPKAAKASATETPASFTGKWNVATVLYRDSSPNKSLENRRERLFHKSIDVQKDTATLLDQTCTSSSMTVKIEDADAESKRRHVSKNELGIIRTTDRLLVASLTCKTSTGEVAEHLYRRVRDGKVDGTLIIITPDFMVSLDQK